MHMRLHDGIGHSVEVKPGLVAKDGLFLLLLDDRDAYTRHFMFSCEADLISKLFDEISRLESEKERQQEHIDTLAEKLGKRCAEIKSLRDALSIYSSQDGAQVGEADQC